MSSDPQTPKARRTRQAILDAAMALAGAEGPGAVDVRAICARAGVGRTSFYTYFPDTDAVLAEAAQTTAGAIRARFNALHRDQPRGPDRLRLCLDMVLALGVEDPDLTLFLTAMAERNPAIPDLLRTEITAEIGDPKLADHLACCCLGLARANALGTVRADPRTQTAYLMRVLSP